MPRVQSTNDSTVMNDYIACISRRNNPRVHYKICEKCIHKVRCAHYKSFKLERPDLYPVVKK
jgi:hypothetical protein